MGGEDKLINVWMETSKLFFLHVFAIFLNHRVTIFVCVSESFGFMSLPSFYGLGFFFLFSFFNLI